MRRRCWTDSNVHCDAIVTYVTMKRTWTSDRGARRVEIEVTLIPRKNVLVLSVCRDILLSGEGPVSDNACDRPLLHELLRREAMLPCG
jgi:hypothetical protein